MILIDASLKPIVDKYSRLILLPEELDALEDALLGAVLVSERPAKLALPRV